MSNEDNKALKYNCGEKPLKDPFIIPFDGEVLLLKIPSSQNNLEKPYTERKAKHILSGYSYDLICSFDATNFTRGEDSIEKLCKKFKVKNWCIDENEKSELELYHKVNDHCHYTGQFRGTAHNICNLRYKKPKEIPVVAHNGVFDHHFIIKQLPKEFNGQFECFGENTEKYINFSVPIKKEDYNGETNTYKLKFIDSYRFMQSNYQILLITHLKFTKKNAKYVWKEKILNQNAILSGLKIIN